MCRSVFRKAFSTRGKIKNFLKPNEFEVIKIFMGKLQSVSNLSPAYDYRKLGIVDSETVI